MNGTVLDGRSVMEGWLNQRIHEDPPHSNRTPIGAEYGWNGVAWCCETWSVMLRRIGLNSDWQAAVSQAMADAKAGKNGLIWVPRNGVIREGDAVLFDWKGAGNSNDMHIAAWVRDPGTQAKFLTIAGNENDAVMEQWRDRTYVMGFIRPPFRGAAPGPAPTPPTQEIPVNAIILVVTGSTTQFVWNLAADNKRPFDTAQESGDLQNAHVPVLHCSQAFADGIKNAS